MPDRGIPPFFPEDQTNVRHREEPMDTVAKGEAAESGIDAFISKRDRQRRRDEGERPAEELWAISERIYAAKRRRSPPIRRWRSCATPAKHGPSLSSD